MLPDMPSFTQAKSAQEQIVNEENTPSSTNQQNPANTSANSTSTTQPAKSVKRKVTLPATLQSKLTEAKDFHTRHQRTDEAFDIAIKILNDPSVPIFSAAWYEVADFISELNTKLVFQFSTFQTER